MPKLTDSNRNLVRLAATMEKGSEERRALLAGLKIALEGGPQKGSVIFALRDPKGKLLGSARGYASEGEAMYEFLDRWEGMASHFDAYRNAINEEEEAAEKVRTLAKKVRPIFDEAIGRLGIRIDRHGDPGDRANPFWRLNDGRGRSSLVLLTISSQPLGGGGQGG